ncbi:MAG: 16S rRNA (cytosine(1402)-N(4))-methyltransferase RsmH [Firmicutes bacterium]|nr:16S rRNA (cytosine(1402)-N(4))-methyltransferase RsmH [Bacillota bacterium]
MEFSHKPVLFREAIEGLAVRPAGIYLDGTAGGGGHSRAVAERLTTGRLIAVDQDPDAIAVLQERLGSFPCVTIVQNNFSNMTEIAAQLQIDHLDGVLLDIGVSSRQLDTPERGFSFHADAPLDMRMSQSGPTAADLVNTLPWQSLAEIFSRYGEEKFSRSIAQAIAAARQTAPILTTEQLTEVIRSAIPAKARREGGHPSRRVFQALRIAVNGELDALSRGLDSAFELLAPGGRLAVITFHSLEDRIVKQRMAKWCEGCTCPPDFPVCVCGKKPQAVLVNRKPIEASPQELEENPRSRSAKLRVCEKLAQDH